MKPKFYLIFLLFFHISSTLYPQDKRNNTDPVPYILVPYRIKNLWGFSDQAGNIKIKAIYDSVKEIKYYWTDGDTFKNLMVVTKGKEKMVINHLNQVVVPGNKGFEGFKLDSYNYKTVIVERNNKEGLYYDGKELLPCAYDHIERMRNLSFQMRTGSLNGLINSSGKVIVPQKFIFLNINFRDKQAGKVTWQASNDLKGKSEIFEDQEVTDNTPNNHPMGSTTLRSTFSLRKPGEVLMLDSMIKTLKPGYQNIKPDNEYIHLIYIEKNKKKGLYNANLKKIVIPCEYDDIKVSGPMNAEIIILVKKGFYGFMGEWGNVIVPPIFDTVSGRQLPHTLIKGNHVGMLTESIHYVKPLYKSINYYDAVYNLKTESAFRLFVVETLTGKQGFINDDGFEYFKD